MSSRPSYPPPGRRRSISDPLAVVLLPPPNETPAAREGRLRAEHEAKKRSDNIDRLIREGERQSRRRKVVKVLLLGQSESGKSTTLKQFQLLHTPAAFQAERIAWRFVIYLNLLRSVRRILNAISPEHDAANDGNDDADDYENMEPASIIISGNGHASSSSSSSPYGHDVPNYDRYLKALTPLLELEHKLMIQLSDPEDNDEHEPTHLPQQQQGWGSPGQSLSVPRGNASGGSLPKIVIPPGSRSLPTSPVSPSIINTEELTVSSRSGWKDALSLRRIGNQGKKEENSGELRGWWENPNDPVHVLNRCAPAMIQLWKDPKVRQKLSERRLRLEESSGFYLDEIPRITAKMYFPTNDDVLKARLKTTGVVQHTFSLTTGEFKGVDWQIYDVGGSQQQRHAWAPYFDDVNAIIFLAPISAFDQVLAENTSLNRLQDSLQLWRQVVSNSLLASVNIILFLNKCDLLKQKIDSGIQIKKHMHGYKDRPNDYESVTHYFRQKFGVIHHTYSPDKSRELYIHFTSVTDTKRTQTIILTVRDIILQTNLRSTALM